MVTASIGRGSIAVWDASPRACFSWRELIAVWDASSFGQPPVDSFGELGGGINDDNFNWEGVDCGLGRIPPGIIQLAGVDCGLGRILLRAAAGRLVW